MEQGSNQELRTSVKSFKDAELFDYIVTARAEEF